MIDHLCSNGDLDLNTSLNIDDDLLDDLSRRIQVDQTLVDPVLALAQISSPIPPSRMRLVTHLISNISQVLLPSPQGVLRVEILRFLVGRRTGPLTRSSLLLARSMSSVHTFSREATFLLVRVMRILWILGESIWDVFLGSWNDILAVFGGVVRGCWWVDWFGGMSGHDWKIN